MPRCARPSSSGRRSGSRVANRLGEHLGHDRARIVGACRDLGIRSGSIPTRNPNAGDDEAHFVCEVRPALQFESLIETMFSLAADGKTNKKGMPNPLRLAVIANAHFDTVRLPFPPAWTQKLGLALGAPLGRLLGYRSSYEPRVDAEPALGV